MLEINLGKKVRLANLGGGGGHSVVQHRIPHSVGY